MDSILLQGRIECECGNIYYFQSIRSEVKCIRCGRMNPNNGESIPEVEVLPEEGE